MSYNITVDVDEEGKARLNVDASYTKDITPGRYVLNGHQVIEGDGYETITASDPRGNQATAGHKVSVAPA
jgi:hypothetical protein